MDELTGIIEYSFEYFGDDLDNGIFCLTPG